MIARQQLISVQSTIFIVIIVIIIISINIIIIIIIIIIIVIILPLTGKVRRNKNIFFQISINKSDANQLFPVLTFFVL